MSEATGKAASRPFLTTQWSVVAQASSSSTPQAHQALELLCERYWYPLYAYVRRRGHDEHQAQDLTQGFFESILAGETLAEADRNRGKFRTFLLSSLSNYLANQRRHEQAQKRGGGRQRLSLDFQQGEEQYRNEPFHELTPERIFERRWAVLMLDQAMGRLQEEYETNGRSELFAALKPTLAGGPLATYAELANQFEMTESAIKVTVHRLRRRYREILQNLIAETVSHVHEVDDELAHLLSAL